MIKETVEILVDESEEAVNTLIENGVKFTGDKKGLFYTREGGHRKFRILYCEDQTGKYIMESLIEKVLERDNIKNNRRLWVFRYYWERKYLFGNIGKKKRK